MHEAINVIQHINRSNDKKNFIISIDLEKTFDQIQHNFMTNALYKLGMEGMYLNIVMVACNKPITNIVLYGEN
jgi:hypothetical protein